MIKHTRPSRVSYGHPVGQKRWHMTLDCGHAMVFSGPPPCVGAVIRCDACVAADRRELEHRSAGKALGLGQI